MENQNEQNKISQHNILKHTSAKRNKEHAEQYDEPDTVEIVLNSSTSKSIATYDYDKLKEEYYQEVQQAISSNKSYNYTANVEHVETIHEAIEKMVDFKKPKNCSKESKNFGIKSVECLWEDFRKSQTKMDKRLLKRLIRILVIWFLIYAAIAIPCWCQYGICCCCCFCSFCQPRRLINQAKKYVVDNPPGVIIEDGKEIQYEPTIYEIEAYNKLLMSVKRT